MVCRKGRLGLKEIRFDTVLHRPGGKDKGAEWTFLRLPDSASLQLPSRGMVSVEGTLDGTPFLVTLEPDGEEGHWMKVSPSLRGSASPGEKVEVALALAKEEPEPEVPEDLLDALEKAPPKALETWQAITKAARRDWIFWIVSGKKAETRVKRIEVAISKLSAGSRRPCCFDRSGIYSKSLSCPVPDSE